MLPLFFPYSFLYLLLLVQLPGGVYRHQLLTWFIFWFNSEAKPISFLANPFDRLVL